MATDWRTSFPSDYATLTGTRAEILHLAEEFLGNNGASGLELKRIASEIGATPSLINHYYGSAEVLILDTVLYSYRKTVSTIQAKREETANPETLFRHWVTEMLTWTRLRPGVAVVLEFPQGVVRRGHRADDAPDLLIRRFLKEVSSTGTANVAFLASTIRAMQKNTDFKPLSAAQVATLVARDKRFAMYLSLSGFATIGGGLWIAGRRPDERTNPIWAALGFLPDRQIKATMDAFVQMVKGSK